MNTIRLNRIGTPCKAGGNSGGGGGIPNYEINGDVLPLYYLIEGGLAEKIYNGIFNGDALKVSEAESFFEKMNNAWVTLIKFPDIPQLLKFDLISFDSNLRYFSIGFSSIDSEENLNGLITTFTKDGDSYNTLTNYYPIE